MSKEKVEAQLAAYEKQLEDCEGRIQVTRESFDQLKVQRDQLRGAIFAAKETLTVFEESTTKENEDVKES